MYRLATWLLPKTHGGNMGLIAVFICWVNIWLTGQTMKKPSPFTTE